MSLQLDHLFIITEPKADIAEEFLNIGLVEGSSNTHPGQGTANRRFFLNDFTIELLYISDKHEAANGAGHKLGLLNRWTNKQASPFGIITRVIDPESTPDFPNWQYYPDYFNGKMCFHVGNNSDNLQEPLCICMPPALPKPDKHTVDTSNENWSLTQLQIDTPASEPSPTLHRFESIARVKMHYNAPHQLLLTLNNGDRGKTKDLSPIVPVSLSW